MNSNIVVTTGDINQDYQIIGPVYFQISNKGIFSNALSKLVKQYEAEIVDMKRSGQMGEDRADWGFLYGEWSVGQSDFEKAFFVSVEELKKRAALLGADAIISMRQDIDLDTNSFQYFYLQMYGTAVKLS
ncbi:heavy metal-binding domain-containing protein [Candidatus Poribacteria bacterium]|nr:heavy metal-binding domain-containing protein [Candidatus Poribacteria bacterium]